MRSPRDSDVTCRASRIESSDSPAQTRRRSRWAPRPSQRPWRLDREGQGRQVRAAKIVLWLPKEPRVLLVGIHHHEQDTSGHSGKGPRRHQRGQRVVAGGLVDVDKTEQSCSWCGRPLPTTAPGPAAPRRPCASRAPHLGGTSAGRGSSRHIELNDGALDFRQVARQRQRAIPTARRFHVHAIERVRSALAAISRGTTVCAQLSSVAATITDFSVPAYTPGSSPRVMSAARV